MCHTLTVWSTSPFASQLWPWPSWSRDHLKSIFFSVFFSLRDFRSSSLLLTLHTLFTPLPLTQTHLNPALSPLILPFKILLLRSSLLINCRFSDLNFFSLYVRFCDKKTHNPCHSCWPSDLQSCPSVLIYSHFLALFLLVSTSSPTSSHSNHVFNDNCWCVKLHLCQRPCAVASGLSNFSKHFVNRLVAVIVLFWKLCAHCWMIALIDLLVGLLAGWLLCLSIFVISSAAAVGWGRQCGW